MKHVLKAKFLWLWHVAFLPTICSLLLRILLAFITFFLANKNSFQKGTHIFISQCAKFVKVFLVRLTLQRYLFLSYTQYMFPFVKAHIPNPKVCFHMQKYLQSHLFQFTSTYFHFHKYLFFFAKVLVSWFDFHLLILCNRTWLNPFQLSHCLGVVAEDPIQKVK